MGFPGGALKPNVSPIISADFLQNRMLRMLDKQERDWAWRKKKEQAALKRKKTRRQKKSKKPKNME